jgi:exonuclease SbcC
MKPLKLDIENFGPFAGKTSIDFTTLDDIFLITGKTGAGKTTIFDAICFALYGRVPGGRNDHPQRLKSDFGTKYGDECSVKLEFMIGERRFRIERSPKQEKPKRRGTGVVVVEESAAFFEKKKGEWESVNARKSEVDEKIRGIIGLDANEFFKIVLLPQGEFAEFLRQTSTERKGVLGKLFPIDDAAKIREIVVERAKEAASQANQIRLSIEEAAKRLPSGDLDDIKTRYMERLSFIKRKIKQSTEDYTVLKDKLRQKQEEKRIKERLLGVKQELLSINSREVAIKEKEYALALSREAQPLMQFIALEEAERQNFNRCSEEWEAARENTVFARQKANELELRSAEISALEEESHVLRERLPLLREMRDEEKIISAKKDEAAAEERQTSRFAIQKGALEQKSTDKDEEIRKLQSSSSQAEALDTLFEDERTRKDELVSLKSIMQDMEPLLRDEGSFQSAIQNIERRLNEFEKDIPVRADELKRLETEKTASENANRAAHLAAILKKGEPCPVCGNCEHPHPAAAAERVFGLDERIESCRHSLKDAEQDAAVGRIDLKSKKQELNRIQKQIFALFKKASDLGFFNVEADDAEFDRFRKTDRNEIDALLKKQIMKLNTVTERRQAAKQSSEKLPILYKDKIALQTQVAELEKQLALSAEKQKTLNEEAAIIERKLAVNIDANLIAQEGANRVETALEDTETRLNRIEKTRTAFRDESDRTQKELSAATARENSAFHSKESAEGRLSKEAFNLQEAVDNSSFASASEVKAMILGLETEAGFEQEIGMWKQERVKLLSRKDELEDRLISSQTEEPMDDVGIASELEKNVIEREELEAERDDIQAHIASIERDGALLREKREQWAALNKESEMLSRLKGDIEGRNHEKHSFEAWLLGKYLAEIAAFASKRLQKMSEGRYSLLIDKERARGRGYSGLDLEVFDAYTGKTRPCATLSGGESFLASISLALGLADSIQSRSGGVRLDAVFIDEGFGSLDEASLDKAMGILDELRDSRMVGLISHVEALRFRVPSRIEVVKGAEGSRVKSFSNS